MSVANPSDTGFAVVPNWMARDGSISAAAKAVYMVLSSRTGREGKCWPSQSSIANDSGFGVTRVKEAIRELVTLGVLTVVVQTTARGRRNIYTLSMGVGRPSDSPVSRPSGQEEEPVEEEPSLSSTPSYGRVSSLSEPDAAVEGEWLG